MAAPPAIRVTPPSEDGSGDDSNQTSLAYSARSGSLDQQQQQQQQVSSMLSPDTARADANRPKLTIRLKRYVEDQAHLNTPPPSDGRRTASPVKSEFTCIPYTPKSLENLGRTPPEQVRQPVFKSALQYNLELTPRLRALGKNASNHPENLRLLVEGVRRLVQEKWKTLIIYFNEECKLPWKEYPWSHMGLTKWRIIEILTGHLERYAGFVKQAERDGLELDTLEADQEMMQIITDLVDLGAKTDSDTIFIKDWEREGMLSFMRSGVLATSDVY